ncbi:uncharacterized protein LAESUDRAFT_653810 [Laetiporus sulphureus 93-53]|uniref:SprT-like domain-containing protein n=1 Tax=Laetiporus sulphureus 93-53 TaxID=1314785 RepID=A0A165E497_9APHY|nr:uncharacterized protein LAESUDRAFT_653810 [Laetiporus sulphureus 93-53]KZT06217.1 hypothetical protein LAESUDRAFT_653810 [Laetiporus sulphureus 93-53]
MINGHPNHRDAPDGAHKAGPLLNESVPHSNLDNVPPASHSHPRRIGSYKSSSESDVEVRPTKRTPAATPRKAGKTPRRTQKAMRDAEQARREAFARALFEDLNRTIFGEKIPATTQLTWNKRLLTTAGRARWHKSNDNARKYEIELATKILDCDERIRNTLSHEMCHLACWIIDEDPKEHHGRKFKAWYVRVMRKRPDIEVTTRHNYDIVCKYQWKCEQCNHIYGRHSKSMRPNAVCGRCNAGRLIPLFENTRRAPRTPIAKTGIHLPSTQSNGGCIPSL